MMSGPTSEGQEVLTWGAGTLAICIVSFCLRVHLTLCVALGKLRYAMGMHELTWDECYKG